MTDDRRRPYLTRRHAAYLRGLRARHAADREALRLALDGQRPGALMRLEQHHAAIERETRRALEAVSRGRE